MKHKMKKSDKKELRVKIPDELRAAKYSNLVHITTTSDDEVILDFVFYHPQERKKDGEDNEVEGMLISRVVLSKNVAKKLNDILKTHLKKKNNATGN